MKISSQDIERYRKTRKFVDCIEEIKSLEGIERKGFIYCDHYHIEINDDGSFSCLIGNDEYISHKLEDVEQELFLFMFEEGF